MFRQAWLVSAVCACLAAPASASYQLDSLQPLNDNELASYRAGFLGDDFMVNIGLDIATSINGETLFNNRIANLFFQNGQLIATQPEVVPVTTVVQVGNNNSVALPTPQPASQPASTPTVNTPAAPASTPTVVTPATPSIVIASNGSAPPSVVTQSQNGESQVVAPGASTSSEPTVEQPTITVTQVTNPVASVTQSAINQVIQNSLNNTVINFQTVINVDAQVNGALQRLESRHKLQQALQFNFN